MFKLVVAVQANMPDKDAAVASAYAMFAQYLGGAIFICVARTIFTSSLGPALAKYAPGVDPQRIINIGVTEIRQVLPASQLQGVLEAYNLSITHVYVRTPPQMSSYVMIKRFGERCTKGHVVAPTGNISVCVSNRLGYGIQKYQAGRREEK
jgi:hypothetical protein